jgi:hypothetical protein
MRSALSTGAPPFPIPGIAPQKQAENFEKKAIFTVKSSPRKKKEMPHQARSRVVDPDAHSQRLISEPNLHLAI